MGGPEDIFLMEDLEFKEGGGTPEGTMCFQTDQYRLSNW